MPVVHRPVCGVFVDEAIARGWQLPQRHMAERIRSICRLRRIAHQMVRRVLHRRGRGRHRAGGDPRRGPGRQGVAAAVERRQRGLRDRPAEGARVQDRDAARARSRPRRSATWRYPSTFGRTGRRRCGKRDSTRASRPHGPPRDCCPTCLRTARICCSSASPTSAPRAAASPSRLSAPGSSIRSTWPAAANGCGRCAKRQACPTTRPTYADLWFIEDRTEVTDWFTDARLGRVGDRRRGSDEEIQPHDRRRHDAANGFRRGETDRLVARQLELDERADGLDGLAQRRQPRRDGRRGQHRIPVGLPHRKRVVNAYNHIAASGAASAPATMSRALTSAPRAPAIRSNRAIIASSTSRMASAPTGSPGSSGHSSIAARGYGLSGCHSSTRIRSAITQLSR